MSYVKIKGSELIWSDYIHPVIVLYVVGILEFHNSIVGQKKTDILSYAKIKGSVLMSWGE